MLRVIPGGRAANWSAWDRRQTEARESATAVRSERAAAMALRVVASGESAVGGRAAGSSSRAGVNARFAEREGGVRDIHFRPPRWCVSHDEDRGRDSALHGR